MSSGVQKLSNLQLELLKLYSMKVSDNDLIQIKSLIAQYFAEKAMNEADKIFDEKGFTIDDMENISQKHLRTTYNVNL